MSKLSEEISAALEGIHSWETALSVVQSLTDRENAEIPGFTAFNRSIRDSIIALLRTAKLHFAGAEPWPDGETAIKETAGKCQTNFFTHQLKCMVAGVLVARDFPNEKDYNALLSNIDFKLALTTESFQVALDKEAMEVIGKSVAEAVVNTARGIDFEKVTGKGTYHIWDVWNTCLGSNGFALYLAGIRLGRKWREQQVLEGILQATNTKDSNESHQD